MFSAQWISYPQMPNVAAATPSWNKNLQPHWLFVVTHGLKFAVAMMDFHQLNALKVNNEIDADPKEKKWGIGGGVGTSFGRQSSRKAVFCFGLQ